MPFLPFTQNTATVTVTDVCKIFAGATCTVVVVLCIISTHVSVDDFELFTYIAM